jgi:1-phosphatidylinositol-4-phosphate 5-kinase
MESVFYTARFIHLIYDLKGSSYGRAATEKDINSQPTKHFTMTVLKDNDLREADQKIRIGGEAAKKMKTQIAADAKFLADIGIIDYSLLIGIHYPLRGDPRKQQAELEQKKTGQVPLWERAGARGRSPTVPIDTRSGYKGKMITLETENQETEMKKVSKDIVKSQSKLKVKTVASGDENKKEATERSPKKQSGTATTPTNRGILSAAKGKKKPTTRTRTRSIMSDAATKEVYFVGIIDILVQYGVRKRGEYIWKSRLKGLGDTVSVPCMFLDRSK